MPGPGKRRLNERGARVPSGRRVARCEVLQEPSFARCDPLLGRRLDDRRGGLRGDRGCRFRDDAAAESATARPRRRVPRRILRVSSCRATTVASLVAFAGCASVGGATVPPSLSCDSGRVAGCVRRWCVCARNGCVRRLWSARGATAPLSCDDGRVVGCVRRLCVCARSDAVVVVRQRSRRWVRSPVVRLCEERRRRCRATTVASLVAFAGCASVRGATAPLSCDSGRVVPQRRPGLTAPGVPAAPPGGLTAAQPRGRPHRPCATRPSASATARARGRRSAVRAGRRRRSGSPASA